MSQIGTLEALIGWKSAILRRWLVRTRCIPITCSCDTLFSVGEARNCGFGLPGRSFPPQVDSDKLWNELHSEEQMSWRREARDETQRWELQRWWRAMTCIISFWFILCDARKDSVKLTFILKQCLILPNVCVIIVTRRSVIRKSEIVSRFDFASACEYCISSFSNVPNLSNTVPNSLGISNKV